VELDVAHGAGGERKKHLEGGLLLEMKGEGRIGWIQGRRAHGGSGVPWKGNREGERDQSEGAAEALLKEGRLPTLKTLTRLNKNFKKGPLKNFYFFVFLE
jgi:hypothetical protein